jgi:ribonuclease HII
MHTLIMASLTRLSVGIDEAGRGCILGPMVVACVAADEADRKWFWANNVRDSKIVPGPQRDMLAKKIMERCWFRIAVVEAPTIDAAVRDRTLTLNGLERDTMADLLRDFRDEFEEREVVALVDAPSINAQGFLEQLYAASGWDEMASLHAKHEADRRDRTVAAASIIAKYERERLFAKLTRELGEDVGCGYCHDPKTKAYITRAPCTATHVRWSWKTAESNKATTSSD